MSRPQWLPSTLDLPGVAVAFAVGGAALGIVRALPPSPFLSDVLLAMILGALVLNTPLRRLIGLAIPSVEREPDRYASGFRYTGKWVLRLGIVLMGLKLQTSFFGRTELLLIASVALVALPSAFLMSHAFAVWFGVRRPMADLLAGGTMICGASAVNAIAPISGARRDEQGLAIGVVFLFSVVALIAFRPIALALGLSSHFAGLWSGLAVNDLSSAMAVGAQMGGEGGVMAAASKSARVLLLAPTLLGLSVLRHRGGGSGLRKSVLDNLPRFLFGYVGLAIARAAGDVVFGASPDWAEVIVVDKFLVDLLLTAVSAGIGLHLDVRSLLAAGARAVAVGGGASLWMASLTLSMIVGVARGAPTTAALTGALGLIVAFVAYRAAGGQEAEVRGVRRRFEQGLPLSLAEGTTLLNAAEGEGPLEDAFLRRTLAQLHPSIGELIPVRESPLAHGEGCRWVTYWEGKSGWALVAVCRDPGSSTPVHAHPHRLLGKAIEGVLEELRFDERAGGELELTSRSVLGHNDLVETDGLATLHLVRNAGVSPAIDLQLRGPESGAAGRRLETCDPVDFTQLNVGAIFATTERVDDRPGQHGDGARAGRPPPTTKTKTKERAVGTES